MVMCGRLTRALFTEYDRSSFSTKTREAAVTLHRLFALCLCVGILACGEESTTDDSALPNSMSGEAGMNGGAGSG